MTHKLLQVQKCFGNSKNRKMSFEGMKKGSFKEMLESWIGSQQVEVGAMGENILSR